MRSFPSKTKHIIRTAQMVSLMIIVVASLPEGLPRSLSLGSHTLAQSLPQWISVDLCDQQNTAEETLCEVSEASSQKAFFCLDLSSHLLSRKAKHLAMRTVRRLHREGHMERDKLAGGELAPLGADPPICQCCIWPQPRLTCDCNFMRHPEAEAASQVSSRFCNPQNCDI